MHTIYFKQFSAPIFEKQIGALWYYFLNKLLQVLVNKADFLFQCCDRLF